MRLDGRAGEDVGYSPLMPLFGGEEEGAVARSLVRVGACADELRFMGVDRSGVLADVGKFLRKEIVESLCATLDGADVERFLGGRRELDDAVRKERRTSK